jgi:HSP20 family molecular chaperone IbpA
MANTMQNLSARTPDAPERVKQRASTSPRVDVFENANELLVYADVPGVAKDALTIHVEKGQLTLEARRDPGERGSAILTEYRPVDYYRLFTVPQGIDATKIEAELSAGVLRLKLPKSEALKPRKVEIKAS